MSTRTGIKPTVPVRHSPAAMDPPGPGIFEANLAAIARRQPELADRLRVVELGDAVRFMRGRDGRPHAQLRDATGLWRWLGSSSAPSLSGPLVAADFELESMNLAAAGLGSGWEVRALAERMSYYQAVFCLLTDAPGLDGLAAASAVLRLTDLSDLLSAGKLVLAVEQGPGSLTEFLERNHGFLPPGQLLHWPWQSAEEFIQISAKVNRISQSRIDAIGQTLAEVSDRFAQWERKSKPSGRPMRVMGLAPGNECAARLAIEGLVASAGQGRCFLVAGPDGAAPVAQAEAVAGFAPDLVVLADRTRRDFAVPLPNCCRVATWVLDPAADVVRQPKALLEKWTGGDFLFAASAEIEELALKAGYPAAQVGLLPLGTDGQRFAPGDSSADYECDVAIVGDVISLDAEKLGIDWASHQDLWRECIRQISTDPLNYSPAAAERFLDRASEAAGVAVRDAKVRGRYVDAVRQIGGPNALRLVYARAACAKVGGDWRRDATVRLAGSGWADAGFDASLTMARPANWAEWRRLFNSARVVVFVSDRGEATQELMDAAACGASILFGPAGAGRGRPVDAMFTPAEVARFGDVADFLVKVGDYLRFDGERRELGFAARGRVEREHLLSQRFTRIVAQVTSQRSRETAS